MSEAYYKQFGRQCSVIFLAKECERTIVCEGVCVGHYYGAWDECANSLAGSAVWFSWLVSASVCEVVCVCVTVLVRGMSVQCFCRQCNTIFLAFPPRLAMSTSVCEGVRVGHGCGAWGECATILACRQCSVIRGIAVLSVFLNTWGRHKRDDMIYRHFPLWEIS